MPCAVEDNNLALKGRQLSMYLLHRYAHHTI